MNALFNKFKRKGLYQGILALTFLCFAGSEAMALTPERVNEIKATFRQDIQRYGDHFKDPERRKRGMEEYGRGPVIVGVSHGESLHVREVMDISQDLQVEIAVGRYIDGDHFDYILTRGVYNESPSRVKYFDGKFYETVLHVHPHVLAHLAHSRPSVADLTIATYPYKNFIMAAADVRTDRVFFYSSRGFNKADGTPLAGEGVKEITSFAWNLQAGHYLVPLDANGFLKKYTKDHYVFGIQGYEHLMQGKNQLTDQNVAGDNGFFPQIIPAIPDTSWVPEIPTNTTRPQNYWTKISASKLQVNDRIFVDTQIFGEIEGGVVEMKQGKGGYDDVRQVQVPPQMHFLVEYKYQGAYIRKWVMESDIVNSRLYLLAR